MKLLAFDTSSLACTVGVMADGDVVERHEEKPREHTALLMPMIRGCLADSGVALQELDAIVAGNGPGSFIGMRIAASVAQGLAHGAGLRIVPVSSMAAVALAAGNPGDTVVVTQDAHMNEVYLGIYRIGEDGCLEHCVDERLHDQSAVPELESLTGNVVAAGFGWQRYPAMLESNRERIHVLSDHLHPRARQLLELGEFALSRGDAIEPAALDPAYLRQKVASRPADKAP